MIFLNCQMLNEYFCIPDQISHMTAAAKKVQSQWPGTCNQNGKSSQEKTFDETYIIRLLIE